jgi:outer membrane protein assembly factor BamA
MPKRMRVVILLLAFIAVPAVLRAAEPRVRVIGTRALTTERAQAILRSGGFPAAAGVRALQEAYLREGYLFVELDVRHEADSSYSVLVEEGNAARVGSASVRGAISRPVEDVLRALQLEPGTRFEPSRLERSLSELLASYDAAGFPFAQVWVDSVGVDRAAGTVDIAFYIVEGNARDVTGVVIEGLKKTRPELAARIAGVEPGVPYSARVLEDMYLRLVSSGVFLDVAFPTVRVASDGRGVDAVAVVTESARSHSFSAALGYASADASSDRVLSGLARLELNNIGGTLKDFGLMWNNDGNGRSETRIQYKDRLFLGRRMAVGLRLEQTGQDTLYTWQSLGVTAERGFGRVAGTLLTASVGAFGDRNVFSQGSLLRSTRVRGQLGVTGLWGSERRAAYARLGAAASLASKNVSYREGSTGPGDVSQTIYDAYAEAMVPAFWALYYSLLGAAHTLESEESSIPLSEQFYLGGARTVRGYKENQYHGRRIAYARNELRLGRTPREGLYVFADAGYVLQESTLADGSVTETGTGLAGFGFGVRSASRLGRIDLSFAVSDELSLQSTKVHVLLEQNF